jgi:hypothetical protein
METEGGRDWTKQYLLADDIAHRSYNQYLVKNIVQSICCQSEIMSDRTDGVLQRSPIGDVQPATTPQLGHK